MFNLWIARGKAALLGWPIAVSNLKVTMDNVITINIETFLSVNE
jgi:hypothetical protein